MMIQADEASLKYGWICWAFIKKGLREISQNDFQILGLRCP